MKIFLRYFTAKMISKADEQISRILICYVGGESIFLQTKLKVFTLKHVER